MTSRAPESLKQSMRLTRSVVSGPHRDDHWGRGRAGVRMTAEGHEGPPVGVSVHTARLGWERHRKRRLQPEVSN